MKKLCMFGGTFNPPHLGHIEAARFVINTLAPDLLLWIPAGDPPHKPLPPNTPGKAERLEMSRLAACLLPNTVVSPVEMDGGARYTADTARIVYETYRPKELWLCVGGDMLLTLDKWVRQEDIFALCHIAALSRLESERDTLLQKADELSQKYRAEIQVLHNPVREISSTELRARLAKGEGAAFLPASVYEYIQKEKLYA